MNLQNAHLDLFYNRDLRHRVSGFLSNIEISTGNEHSFISQLVSMMSCKQQWLITSVDKNALVIILMWAIEQYEYCQIRGWGNGLKQ